MISYSWSWCSFPPGWVGTGVILLTVCDDVAGFGWKKVVFMTYAIAKPAKAMMR